MGKKLEAFAAAMQDPTASASKRRTLYKGAKDEVFRIRPKSEKRKRKAGRTKKK